MNQQINLYHGDNSNAKKPLILYTMLFVFFVAAFIMFSVHLKNGNDILRVDVKIQQHALADAEAYTSEMKTKYPKKEHNALLEKRIKQSQILRQNLVDVMSLVSDDSSDKTQGFSRYFTAFAQQKTAGVWINQVSINAEQNSINLFGSTKKAGNVPVFFQNLHTESIFKGKIFSNLNMNTNTETGELHFNLNTLLVDSTDDETTTSIVNKRTAAMAAKIKGSR